ncbi:MAG: hypothetical protein H8E26_01695 [FCB group bacterium]|nr:hypothetical protein [FCB group bacterium]MBL7029415.1 hypothetical protein [Candidatus Neomarinimicrobiota bacterium]MBL7123198.1 hypothetical protein [Candidatus Neomarinimicrobiota bacterium]
MKDGQVYVFSEWKVMGRENLIQGNATLLSIDRDVLKTGSFKISIDSVAIIESNKVITSSPANALSFLTGLSGVVTGICLANPKACFGSCPTFYTSNGDSMVIQAEGFSSSVAPSLIATDIDALYSAAIRDEIFEIEMRNEALETHVIDYVDLLLLPKSSDDRVYYDSDGLYWESSCILSPSECYDQAGDCLADIIEYDGYEWFSEADSFNLAEQEIIEIQFDNLTDDRYGLIIGARQTLLTTFLFYQTLSYMGTNVGEWMALLERSKTEAKNPFALLGGIEVVIKDKHGQWQTVGEMEEIGPIATDVHIIPLPESLEDDAKLGLRLTKGNWRIDYIALASIQSAIEPIRIEPTMVYYDSNIDEKALSLLKEPEKKLTTLPGDIYRILYAIPDDYKSYELFIESRGYYLEWIRDEWITEEDPQRLSQILFHPKDALKELASDFKEIEAEMEDVFWRSKYGN